MGENHPLHNNKMPIYEYECKNGHRFDDFNSIGERQRSACPKCGEVGYIRISKPNMRVAQPVRLYTADGKLIGWKPDGGISPLAGQPYPVGG